MAIYQHKKKEKKWETSSKKVTKIVCTKKLRPFLRGYVFDPKVFLLFSKSVSSPGIPLSVFVFNKFDKPLTW